MKEKGRVWFAKATVIVFLMGMLLQLVLGNASAWSAMRAVVYFGVLFAGYRWGISGGAMSGVIVGLVEILGGQGLECMGLLCVMGVLAGCFRRLGRGGSVIAFLCAASGLGLLYVDEYFWAAVPEILVASVLFLLLPVDAMAERSQKEGVQGSWEDLQRQRLEVAADSYGKLAKSMVTIQQESRRVCAEQAEEAVVQAMAMVCGGCRRCEMGQGAEWMTLAGICEAFHAKDSLDREDLPETFRKECPREELYLEVLADRLGSMEYEEGWRSRFLESREAVSIQFREMERTLKEMAAQLDQAVDVTDTFEKQIRQGLRRHRLQLKQLLVLENEEERQEAYVTVCSNRSGCVTAREVGESVGKTLSRSLRPADGGRTIVGKEPCTIRLVEDTRFRLLSGLARACKDEEELSGDNFSCHDLPDGRMMLCLSDGMGSGRQAYLESQLVTELLEELLDAGFAPERAIYMVNALLLVQEEQVPTTLDLALVDLYTGRARFFKQGAVGTFIRRGDQVLQVEPGSLPMGVDCEASPLAAEVQLEDGDMIVMVTDGVLDALAGEDQETLLCQYLSASTKNNARELAEEVLRLVCEAQAGVQDDMTVLTAGIWKK